MDPHINEVTQRESYIVDLRMLKLTFLTWYSSPHIHWLAENWIALKAQVSSQKTLLIIGLICGQPEDKDPVVGLSRFISMPVTTRLYNVSVQPKPYL